MASRQGEASGRWLTPRGRLPGHLGRQLQSSCGQLGLGPPAGAAGSSGGGGEGGAGAAGPRDGERHGGHRGRVQLDAVVGGRGRGGRVLVSPGGRGAQLDAANTLSELQRADRLAHVAGQRRHLNTTRREAVRNQQLERTASPSSSPSSSPDMLVSGSHDVIVGSGIKQALFRCNPS